MVVLLDTNIIIDHLVSRQPFSDNSNKILTLCFHQKCEGYVAAHTIPNIFYIIRKQFSENERKKMLIELCEFIEVAGIHKNQILNALTNEDFKDFEDCLQVECAKLVHADYIVTRNIDDFLNSSIPAILPEKFLQMI